LLNKAALVEQYYRFIHADASAGNEGIPELFLISLFQCSIKEIEIEMYREIRDL
jgi:hypothetical protein